MGVEWAACGAKGGTTIRELGKCVPEATKTSLSPSFGGAGARTGTPMAGRTKQGGEYIPAAWSRQVDYPNTAEAEAGRYHDVSQIRGRVVTPSIVRPDIVSETAR